MSTAHINVFLWKKDSTNMQSSVENQSIDYFYLPLTLHKALLADFSFWKQPGEFLLTDIQVNFANHLYTLNSIRMSTTHTITQSSESQPLCIVAAARASKAFTQSKWWVELIDWLVFHNTLHIWRVFFSQKNIYSGCRMNTVHHQSHCT